MSHIGAGNGINIAWSLRIETNRGIQESGPPFQAGVGCSEKPFQGGYKSSVSKKGHVCNVGRVGSWPELRWEVASGHPGDEHGPRATGKD